MLLLCWPGDWSLPSIDPECLKMITLIKFAGAPATISANTKPWAQSSPTFLNGQRINITDFDELVKHLESQNYTINSHLTESQKQELKIYAEYIVSKLHPFLLYLYWGKELNYTKVIRPFLARHTKFPGNYFIPGHYQRSIKHKLKSLYGDIESKTVEQNLLHDAITVLHGLKSVLSRNNYFFGDRPTTLDAVIYAYIAPMINIPFEEQPFIKNNFRQLPELTNYVDRINKTYFSGFDLKPKTHVPKLDDGEFPNMYRDILISGTIALSLLVWCSFKIGLAKKLVRD